jgi:hypothetical protein
MAISKSVLHRWQHQMPLLHERGFRVTVISGLNELDEFYEVPCVKWTMLKELMSEEEHRRFKHWMLGQTSIAEGCYPHDLERFLEGRPIID